MVHQGFYMWVQPQKHFAVLRFAILRGTWGGVGVLGVLRARCILAQELFLG